MTPTLRKRHRQIWTVLALLLPIGFLWAWISFPISPNLEELSRETAARIPEAEIIGESSSAEFQVQLLQDKTGARQVEIQLLEELRVPSAWAYLADQETVSNPTNLPLLGTIGTKGTYRFAVDSGQVAKGIIVYDIIKKELVQELSF